MTDEQRERLKALLISGGVSGAVLGGGSSLLSGAKGFGKVGKAAALGAALSGGLAAGSGAIGDLLTPRADPDDPQAHSKRGGIGGAVAGGVLGAGAGGLLAIGAGGKGGIGRTLKAALMRNMGRGLLAKGVGSIASPVKGAAALGALGATVGAVQGVDEGMQMDFIDGLRREERRKRMREEGYA